MRKLSVSEWCCAVRFNKNNDSIMTDLGTPFVVLPNSKRYWCADPFLFQKDDHYFVFFEAYDRLKRKGVLGYRQITEHTVGDIHIICESTSHLSYPFIYEADGNCAGVKHVWRALSVQMFIFSESLGKGKSTYARTLSGQYLLFP